MNSKKRMGLDFSDYFLTIFILYIRYPLCSTEKKRLFIQKDRNTLLSTVIADNDDIVNKKPIKTIKIRKINLSLFRCMVTPYRRANENIQV